MDGLYIILIIPLFVLLTAMSLLFVILVLYAKNQIIKCGTIKKQKEVKIRWIITGGFYIFICIAVIVILIFLMF